MENSKSAYIDSKVREAYDQFVQCLTKDNSNGEQFSMECLKEVINGLDSLETDPRSSLGRRIAILKDLIGKKIGEMRQDKADDEREIDYTWKFNELGARFVSKPSRRFADLKGMDEIKKKLRESVIYPFIYKDLSKEFGVTLNGGILLYGPPGNGKTLLAEAMAGEAGLNYIELNPAYLYNEYFGKYEKNISELFKLTRETTPNIVFFDEVETLVPRREASDQGVIKRGVTQLLIEINKLIAGDSNGTVIVAATNLPWEIDPAMLRPGRFGLKIYVPLPSRKDRIELMRNQVHVGVYSNELDIEALADATDGFSFADIVYLFKRASQRAFYESVETGNRVLISTDDIMKLIDSTTVVASTDLIRKYEIFSGLQKSSL